MAVSPWHNHFKMINKLKFLTRKISGYAKQLRDIQLIRKSHLFDSVWYLENNPDVAQVKTNPLLHYFRYGGFEGRDPGPNFSSSWYISSYEDVKQAKINPLVHYLKHGRKEGRTPQPKRIETGNSLYECPVCENKPSGLASIDTGKQKVFCIGLNKTGTTSIESVLKDFGYKVGNQPEAELLMGDWARRDFRQIIRYCETADAFQDVPFSLDFTYQILDYAFPGSKFILTVRNNADEWFESLSRFYSKITGVNGTPTADDLKKFPYRGTGWIWHQQMHIFGADESTLLDEKLYKSYYTNHNDQVLAYFKYRPKDLLVLNLSNPFAMQSLCEFLGEEYVGQTMPRLNQTSDSDTLQSSKRDLASPAIPVSIYDTVYARFAESVTLKNIWRSVYAEEYPEEVGFPYSFITKTELKQIVSAIAINSHSTFIDIACGQGDISLWIAQQTGASIIGVDYSKVAIQHAIAEAKKRGLQENATFYQTDASNTTIISASIDGAISIDSLQLMSNPLAVIIEVARILKPGAVFAFTAWEMRKSPTPGRTTIPDYRPLLEQAGFQVEQYIESQDWRQQQNDIYRKMREYSNDLKNEMGPDASAILLEDARRKDHQLPDFSRVLVISRKMPHFDIV